MGIRLNDATLKLVDGRNYAVVGTVNADGSPHTSVVWISRDDGDLIFTTLEGRVKHRNMLRDPRVSISVIDSADPENYIELRGRASITPDVGRRVDTSAVLEVRREGPGRRRARRSPRCGAGSGREGRGARGMMRRSRLAARVVAIRSAVAIGWMPATAATWG